MARLSYLLRHRREVNNPTDNTLTTDEALHFAVMICPCGLCISWVSLCAKYGRKRWDHAKVPK